MTGGDGMDTSSDCGCDAAAYVLGALEPDEAVAYRRHMSTCAVCRDEVATLQGVADSLPMAALQVAPPRSLRRRLMAEVRADAKRRLTDTQQPARRLRPPWASALPAFGRPALAAGTLLAAIALALGLYELSAGGSGGRIVQASVPTGAGSAVLRLSDGHAELIVRHMPPPPQGRIYEVWERRQGQQPAPTNALFGVNSAGSATVAVPGNLSGVRTVMVTPEPLGGSSAPTRAPVIVAQILPG